MTEKAMPGVGKTPGGDWTERGRQPAQHHHSIEPARAQAPDGRNPVYLRDGLIWCEGRHLASVRAGILQRTFDARREMLFGALHFRRDVLRVAWEAGARRIVATERMTGRVYTVSLAEFMRRGRLYDHKQFGRQVGLPLADFARVLEPGAPRQLSLFREGA